MTVTPISAVAESWCPECGVAKEEWCKGLPQRSVHARRVLAAERGRVVDAVSHLLEQAESYMLLLAQSVENGP